MGGWGGGGVTRVQAVGIDDSRTFIVSVFFFFVACFNCRFIILGGCQN